jgi:recombination protein RecA
MEEKPEFAKEVEKLVREKLEMGAVVSANSVAAAPTSGDVEDEEDEEIDEELEE